MTWTTTRPTARGFFWMRWPGHLPRVVEVCEYNFHPTRNLYVALPGTSDTWDLIDVPGMMSDIPAGSEWAGPIPEPV